MSRAGATGQSKSKPAVFTRRVTGNYIAWWRHCAPRVHKLAPATGLHKPGPQCPAPPKNQG